ncbi:MAG TPA: hypothetical protein VM299_01420 [Solirubrobacteraceae bacterium]|jgi:hypothetical protein|nr:hypothetical protein [Solirubrobacteraceae bacterium]
MSVEALRNIGIVVVVALAVWLVPGGGDGAALVGQLLNALFIAVIAFICAVLYRRYRAEIFSLGDRWRFALYAAVGVAVVAVAAAGRLFDTGAGAALWFALVAGASYTLYLVWRQYRSYS